MTILPDLTRQLAGTRPVVAVNPARRGLEEGVVDPALRGEALEATDDIWHPARAVLAAVFDRLPVRPGIHCCGDAPWSALLDLGPSSLSFDPSAIGD